MPLTPADFDLIPDDDADPIFGNGKVTRGRWRREGGGPPFIKIGRRIFYRQDHLRSWFEAREARSTAESKQKIRDLHEGENR